jgi:biopolymer transport protein ExbB
MILADVIDQIDALMDAGGDVMWALLAVSVTLWALLIERFLYFHKEYRSARERRLALWQSRAERRSWQAQRIRETLVSEMRLELFRTLPIIRVLIALCPMLGLLGTVLGMMDVFEVMRITGSNDARAMASGVSNATITTMAGLVVAISGLYFFRRLETRIADETRHLQDLLKFE